MAKKEWGLIEQTNKKELQALKDELSTYVPPTITSRTKKEVLTELELIFFNKMFNAYESQYKSKSAINHAMCVALRKKLLRMKLIKEVEES